MLIPLSRVDAAWRAVQTGQAPDSETAVADPALGETQLWQALLESTAPNGVHRGVPDRVGNGHSVPAGRRGQSERSGSCLLVAADADGVAAARILTALHKSEMMPYQLHPVTDYGTAVDQARQVLQGEGRSAPPRALILINWGARADLPQLLQLDGRVPVLVLDAHRPYHAANCESRHVLLLHDGDEWTEALPLSGYADVYGHVDDDDEEEEHDHGAETCHRREAAAYYRNAGYGAPSASIAHALAVRLNKATVASLWMWIVGVTAQWMMCRPSAAPSCSTSAWRRYAAAMRAVRHEWRRYVPAGDAAAGQRSDDASSCRVQPSRELQLELLRHWTLYDSLLRSSFTAARLGAWRPAAERQVCEWLVRLGIPLRESRQRWTHMALPHKRAVQERLAQRVWPAYVAATRAGERGERVAKSRRAAAAAADEEGDGAAMAYPSFVLRVGAHASQVVSAADMVLAVMALLNRGDFWRAYDVIVGDSPPRVTAALALAVREQHLLADIGARVMERHRFTIAPACSCVSLRQVPQVERVSHRPFFLQRLAHFLLRCLALQRKHTAAATAAAKPLVLAVPHPSPTPQMTTWLLVAANTPHSAPHCAWTECLAPRLHRLAQPATLSAAPLLLLDHSVALVSLPAESDLLHLLHTLA